jgi:predicted AlkP superfamily phosphohydrolase/phosphomutase
LLLLTACGNPTSPSRVIVLGLDGADWTILDRMLAEGDLPHFRQVIEGGVRAPMVSLENFERSPVLWTSLLTGQLPEQHGIVDFVSTDPASGASLPVSSTERRVPAIWNMLTAVGRSVTVLGMWATYPAESVSGTVLSDRFAYLASKPESQWNLTPAIESQLTFPPELFAEFRGDLDATTWALPVPIERSLGRLTDLRDPAQFPLLAEFTSFHHDDVFYLKQTFREDHLKHRIAKRLLKERPTDLMIHYFRGADVAEHFFWRYWEPESFVDRPGPESFADLVPEYYRYLDEILGDHLRALRRGDALVIVSDHGQRANAEYQGQLSWADVASDERWRTRTERLFRALDLEWSELGVLEGLRGVRYGESWGKNELTLSLDAEAAGRPLPSLRNEVIDRIESMTLVDSGTPLFHLAEGDDPTLLRFEADIWKVTYSATLRVRGKEIPLREIFLTSQRSGDHRRRGIFIGYGAGFRRGETVPEVPILGLTPLLLVLLDAPLGTDLAGEVPLDVLEGDALERGRTSPEVDYAAAWQRRDGSAMSDDAFVEQLRALGYVK